MKDRVQNLPPKPTFGEAFSFWLKLGFISFGGPAGQIAIMHEFLVDKKKWISDSRFMHALNYCMLLPGPEAQQLATYIGWLLHGTAGGLTAGILFILPSIFILLGLSIAYVTLGKLIWVAAIFYGLKPAVVMIILLALIKIGKKSLLSAYHYAVAIISFVLIFFFNVSFPFIIVGAILLGFIGQKLFPVFFTASKDQHASEEDERGYYINKFCDHQPTPKLKNVISKLIIGLLLWAFPVLLFWSYDREFKFWFTLIAFFTKAAFVTFGGAYAVLPYVAQVTVEKFHWLTQYQMIDGMALGETTPGPLIMILVFVGFMAGYNNSNGAIWAGATGLLTTTYYTFLPCFLLILVGAPLVEKTKENENLKRILGIVTAAVVGVILNLAIYFGKAVLFPNSITAPDWFSLLWLLISFVALYNLKMNMILWIIISAVAGMLYHVLGGLL